MSSMARRDMRNGPGYDVYDDTRMQHMAAGNDRRFGRDGRSRSMQPFDQELVPRYGSPQDMMPYNAGGMAMAPDPFFRGFDSFFGDFNAMSANLMRGADEMFAAAQRGMQSSMQSGMQGGGQYSYQSTSRVMGPDGRVREETVYSATGPDGVPSTRRVIREPDGSEHVSVTRDGVPPELRGPGFGDFNMFQPFGGPMYPTVLDRPARRGPAYDPPRIEELPDGDPAYNSRNEPAPSNSYARNDGDMGPRRMRDREFWPPRWRR